MPGLLDAVHCRRGLAGSLAFTASARRCSGHFPAVSRPLLREEEPVLVGQHSVLLCVALGGSRFPFGRRGSTTRPCIRRGFRARVLRRHRALAQAPASRQRPGFSDWRGHGRFGCEGATFACPRPVEEDRNPACRASSTTVYLPPPDAVYCLRCTMMAMQRFVIERVHPTDRSSIQDGECRRFTRTASIIHVSSRIYAKNHPPRMYATRLSVTVLVLHSI